MLDRLQHRRLVLVGVERREVADDRREARLHGAGGDHAGRLAGDLGRLLGGEDDVRVVREHEHLGGGCRLDRGDDLLGRGVHRLPALEHPRGAVPLEEPAVAGAGDDGNDAGLERVVGVGHVRHRPEEAAGALLRLLVHVRDLDALERPEARPRRERRPGLVRVDVDLQRGLVADDEQRVAEALELRLEDGRVETVTLDDEDGAVAELRELLVDRVEARLVRRLGRCLRQRLAGERGDEPADKLQQTRTAGIDDARLLEHRQLLRRARERVLAAQDERVEQLGDVAPGVRRGLRLLGQLADHGQHRPFHRPAHGPVGGVARAAERTRHTAGVDRSRLAEDLGGAAQDLGEDHARVAARAHQRRAGQLLRERCPLGGGGRLERLDDRADGQRQVRAGVAVGDGIDVQVVDPPPVQLEVRERPACELPRALELAHALRLTSWMWTSTAATCSPVSRSTS